MNAWPKVIAANGWVHVCVTGGCAWLTALALATPAIAETRDDRRRADLDFIDEQIRTIHPDPFFQLPETTFEASLARLESDLPRLNDDEFIMRTMQLVAALGDGHTTLLPPADEAGTMPVIPVRLYAFPDGIHIISASPSYREYVGARVVTIGRMSADSAFARARSVTSHDNEFTALDRAPYMLMLGRVVHGLGLSDAPDQLRFEVADRNGRTKSFAAKAVTTPAGMPHWYFMGEGVPGDEAVVPDAASGEAPKAPLPLYRRDRGKNFWFEHVPAENLVWMQFNAVEHAQGDETFRDFVGRMFEFIDAHHVDRLVIDIRQNHGGNNQLLQPLIHGLIKRDTGVNREGHLFTVIGRGTFSAAMNCAAWLEENTHTLFVGEPTGASVHHYGDHEMVTLPNAGIPLLVSHWYWQNRLPWDTRPWIAPHIPAEVSSADYKAGRDPAWDAILRFTKEPGIEATVREAVARAGTGGIAAVYRDYQASHPDRWGRTNESRWNAAGYALLAEGRKDEALEIFRLNAEEYPASANTWDSLAEAHLESGDHASAVRYYRKALDVNPEFRNAARMLARLTDSEEGMPAHR